MCVELPRKPFSAVPAIATKLQPLCWYGAFALLCGDYCVIVVRSFTAAVGHCPSPHHGTPRNKPRVSPRPDHCIFVRPPNQPLQQQSVRMLFRYPSTRAPTLYSTLNCLLRLRTLSDWCSWTNGEEDLGDVSLVVYVGHGVWCPGSRLGIVFCSEWV